jgi:hypothetical protein
VIEARKLRVWDGRYDFIEDGHRVATWESSHWTIGGMIEVGGRTLMVRANLENDEASLTEAGGRRVATARGFARKHWTIEADGATYHFTRAAPWRHEEDLLDEGRRLGFVRRSSFWRGHAAADLPGLPRVVALFAIAVVLTRWASDGAATG